MSPNRARCPGASPAAALLLSLLCAAAAPAAEYTLRPSIDVEQSFDDNALSVDNFAGDHAGGLPSREISTWNTRLAPLVALDRKTATNQTTLEAGFSRRKSYSQSELDGTDEHLLASSRQALTQRLSLGARGSYDSYAAYSAIEEPLIGGRPLVLIGERPEVMIREFSTDLAFQLRPTTELTAEVGWDSQQYGRTPLPQVDFVPSDYLDSESRTISVSMTETLSPTDKVGLIGSFGLTEEISADTSIFLAEAKTENSLGSAIGFWQRGWSQRFSTTIQAGGRYLRSDSRVARLTLLAIDPTQCSRPRGVVGFGIICFPHETDSGSGFVGGATARYLYSDRGSISLSYSHDTRTGSSSATGSSAIDIDSISASLSHRLTQRLTLSASTSYSTYESSLSGDIAGTSFQSDSTTDLWGADLRLTWQLRKNLSAYGSFYYYGYDQDRDTGLTDRDYVRRVFAVGLRYAFDQEL